MVMSLMVTASAATEEATPKVQANSAAPTSGLINLPEGLETKGSGKLYLSYKPGGTTPSSAEGNDWAQGYRLYYLASIVDKDVTTGEGDDAKTETVQAYQVTSTYSGVEGLQAALDTISPTEKDDNALLYQNYTSEALRTPTVENAFLRSVTAYINQNAVQPNATNAIQNGESAFVDLPDGLYYVLGPQSQDTVNGNVYTPVNFLMSLPYVANDDSSNNFVAASKFVVTPVSSPGRPSRPNRPTPTDPTNNNPDPNNDPDPTVDIPDENVPLSDTPDIVNIDDENVPLADLPTDTPTIPELVDILEEDVPLANITPNPTPTTTINDNNVPLARLPQTGLLWWPVPVMGIAGVVCLLVGLKGRRTERVR
jgi:hypothetical protein